ncbi:hypothetical protein LOK49_LG01G03716 [Camellia lanceoleosa]|uniref:Uncharacterized protein n=1 Tax=Camellia lanceoleosa TaxID=1840588 RepID=A0ACC0IW43_9ERIC|nr:hypothetical protein LOK49_LG01G03716 [Camellia lanceoleosa]
MAIDFESGFNKDMDYLKKLIELTAKKHPMTILINGKLPKPPHVLKLKFLYLLEFFSKQDFDAFSAKIIMDGFDKRGSGSKKRKTKGVETKIKYQSSGGIYWLHRNATHHYGGVLRDGDQREPAMQDLLSIFPDALPCIFKKVIEVFHIKEQPNAKFRKSITMYMKEGLQGNQFQCT